MSMSNGIYVEPLDQISCIRFDILGNDEVKKLSVIKEDGGIEIPELYDNSEPKKGGLLDTRMGISSNNILCATCGYGFLSCPGHFGFIELADYCLNPGYFKHFVLNILNCVCYRCSKLLISKNDNEIRRVLKSNVPVKDRISLIKSITKNLTHCRSSNYGCGTPNPKIKVSKKFKKKAGPITIMAKFLIDNDIVSNENVEGEQEATNPIENNVNNNKKKRVVQTVISNKAIYDILKNISDDDCRILGMKPERSRPEDMIIKKLIVPPVQVRPSAKGDFLGGMPIEDDLVQKLTEIIKANMRIKENLEDQSESSVRFNSNYCHLLQMHVSTLIEGDQSSSAEQKNKIFKSISSRYKSKTGRVRGNLNGKRVDFTSRTVITSDPNIINTELGLPIDIAMNITIPEYVSENNIDILRRCVKNGRDIYPGANFVIKLNKNNQGEYLPPIDLRYKKDSIDINIGDIVERHLINGDMVLLNRQPTLHKQSVMGHSIRVVNNKDYMTFRLSVSITTPYNADFDGDEMNIFIPQSIRTQVELEEIASVKKQLITPTTSRTIIGIVQDGLLGAYNLTHPDIRISGKNVMNLIFSSGITDISNIDKNKIYTGAEVFSMLIPEKVNIKRENIEIKNGKIIRGRLTKELLGAKKKNNLIHLILDLYGYKRTNEFINNTQKLINGFNLLHGFSVGIKDTNLDKIQDEEIQKLFNTVNNKLEHFITEVENNLDIMTTEVYEYKLFSDLNIIRDKISKLLIQNIKEDNGFSIMSNSGSKGDATNIGQMIGCLGLQAFEGKIVPKKIINRTLSFFHENDDRGPSRGFVTNSFVKGLNYIDDFNHMCASRIGLIEQAVKSVSYDTDIVYYKGNDVYCNQIGKFIDELLLKDEKYVMTLNDSEILDVINKNIKIHSIFNTGKISLQKVKYVTRHDSNILYEIKTEYGRSVKVVESKSLLVWDEGLKQFKKILTSEVKIGDYLPLTKCFNIYPGFTNIYISEAVGNIIADLYNSNAGIKKSYSISNDFSKGFIKYFINTLKINEIPLFNRDKETVLWLYYLTSLTDYLGNYDEIKNKFYLIHSSRLKTFNDVILVKVISKEKLEEKLYKVYDLTVEQTYNFCLANNLHVVDTAETGYTQKKLIKSGEDIMIKYDCTVRNASNKIIQLVYGDSGADTTKQYEYNMRLIEMNNKELEEEFLFSDEELKKFKNYGDKENKNFLNKIKTLRDKIRDILLKCKLNYKLIVTKFMIPINLNNFINISKDKKDGKQLTPEYILEKLKYVLKSDITKMLCLNPNKKYIFKERDNYCNKTTLKAVLYDSLHPKKCIEYYKLSKKDFDDIINNIISNFNKNMVEPGEMVGIIAAQSMGEPLTQMSCHEDTKILIKDIKNDKIFNGTFKDFYNSLNNNNNLIKLNDYKILSVDKNENVCWADIYEISIHKQNGNLVEIETELGRKTITTLSHSHLKKTTNGIIPIEASKLKIGDFIPIIGSNVNLFEESGSSKDFNDGLMNGLSLFSEKNSYLYKKYAKNNKDTKMEIDYDNFESILNKSKDFIKGFIISYIDSRSYINYSNEIELMVENKEFKYLNIITLLLSSIGCIFRLETDLIILNINEDNETFMENIKNYKTPHFNIKKGYYFIEIKFVKKYISNKNYKIKDEYYILNDKEFLELYKNVINNNKYDLEFVNYIKDLYDKEKNIYWDKIVNIKIIKDENKKVYDFSVKDTESFYVDNGIFVHNTLNSFHHSGIAEMSATVQGVPRMKELLGVTKNPKTPQMIIYLNKQYRKSKEMAYKIASVLKYTTLGNLNQNVEVIYDPNPLDEDSYIVKDKIKKVLFNKGTKNVNFEEEIKDLPFLTRIELNKEKMLEKNVTLLDIKSKFCEWWFKKKPDIKTNKKEEKKIINKISQMEILSNSDNDQKPYIHIRFNVKENDNDKFDMVSINNFIEFIMNNFNIKGFKEIDEITAIKEERCLEFDKDTGEIKKELQYVIYTSGVALETIRYIRGIDLNRTLSNNIVVNTEVFGIEISRTILSREIVNAYERAGGEVNFQHIHISDDYMVQRGVINSQDRNGTLKLEGGPLCRASFEKPVDILYNAAFYGEKEIFEGLSSRIMAGKVINGGTGYCDIEVDFNKIENSENYETDIVDNKYEIKESIALKNIIKNEIIDNDLFIPE